MVNAKIEMKMAKTKTNPEVRFAGFAEDWIPSKLGNIGEVKMCKRIFNNQTSPKGDIPFYKIGTFGKKADSSISNELYQEFRHKYPFPKEGDILISASGTLGRIVVYNGLPAYFQDSNIVWLNHNESKILNEFLYYIYGNITYESEGGTIQRLYNSIILNARFSFPENKDEQTQIGNFFENIDKLITQHQQKHSKLKALKQAMLGKMFPKQGQLVPEIRFKGFEGNWIKYNLEQVSPIRGGFAFKSNEFKKEGVPILKISNILPTGEVGGRFDFYEEQQQDENFLLPNNSAVLAMSGATTGKVSILKINHNEKVYQNQRVGYFQNKGVVDYSFISVLFKSALFSDKMRSVLVAGAQPNVSPKEINAFEFYIPNSNDEQKKIGIYFNNLEELIRNYNLQITKLQNIKKAFLAKMFI